MPEAVVYTRISSDPTGDRLGVQRQEEECRALCESLGWPVVAVYEDDDKSAYSGKSRPRYEAMLESLAAGEAGAVVAWHPDRLHRSPRELEDFIDLVESTKISVATVQAGQYDLTTSAGRQTARIVGAVARGESEHKSERAKAKARQLAKAGKMGGGGTRPYGYNDDRRTLRRSEAQHVREAVDRFLAGDSLHNICADWNERGVPTVSGGTWKTQVLRRVVSSARIAGWREHRGELVAEGEWSPIITLDQHHAVRAILADPSRLKRRTTRRYLLTGLLHCGRCGEKMVARPRDDKRKQYVCAGGVNFAGCGKMSCIAAPLDELLRDAIIEVVTSPDLEARLAAPEADDDAADELRDLEARLDELAEMFAAGEIGRREWMTARDGLDRRLAEARAQATAETTRRASVADARALSDLGDTWDDLPIQRQRSIAELLIDRITLNPAVPGRNFFDPDRVDIEWKQ